MCIRDSLSASKPKKIESYETALDQLYNDTMEKLLQSVDDIYNYFDYIQEDVYKRQTNNIRFIHSR